MSIGCFEPVQERNGAERFPEHGRAPEEAPKRISKEIVRHCRQRDWTSTPQKAPTLAAAARLNLWKELNWKSLENWNDLLAHDFQKLLSSSLVILALYSRLFYFSEISPSITCRPRASLFLFFNLKIFIINYNIKTFKSSKLSICI